MTNRANTAKLRRVLPLLSAVLVPYLIFVTVINLNESGLDLDRDDRKVANFDVEKRKPLKKDPPKKPKPKKTKRQQDALPNIKPIDIGESLADSGLSFGLPGFDEAEFEEFNDDDLFGTGNNGPMDDSTVDTRPKVIRRSPIVYPELARKRGISGYVTMNVLIDESGNVEDVSILDSKPKDIFDLQADTTVRRWKFEPATYNGKAVKVWAMQKISFKLN